MWMKYKFRQLKKNLIKTPFRKEWYRIEKHLQWVISFEKYGEQRKLGFIAKRLWLVQVWKPWFLMDMHDFEPNLAGLYYLKEHWQERWMFRIWDKKENQIKLQKEREQRARIREITEKINHIHIIFREEW